MTAANETANLHELLTGQCVDPLGSAKDTNETVNLHELLTGQSR